MNRSCQKKKGKTVLLVALCLLLLLGSAGGVWAYLSAKTNTLSNRFEPAKVTCRVEESFLAGVKSDVAVRNTGNVKAYIRAAVIATFVDEEGKVLAVSPKEGEDYTVTWGEGEWTRGADGYWYFASPVSPDELTGKLIQTATAASAPEGYRLNLQILATAIQAEPAEAVEQAWGFAPTGDKLLPPQA